jgi:hypothetical protein
VSSTWNLEQAKAVRISPLRLLSDVAREKGYSLEQAGSFTPSGLFDEVKSACSAIVRSMLAGELRSFLRDLDARIDRQDLSAAHRSVRDSIDSLIEQYAEFEHSPWGRRAWAEYGASAATARGGATGRRILEGTGRGAFLAEPLHLKFCPASAPAPAAG